MALPSDRAFDIVLLGATGFTGALTAEQLAARADPGTRWALAGRNAAKLEALRDRLVADHGAPADLPILHADSGDRASLDELAAATRVVITTVGPYLEYGEPLVAACAAHGTDYVDLTGEPEFVDRMYVDHHATAVGTGARIVHACGFDSIPHDLGAHFTVEQLPEGVPLAVQGFVRAGGTFSGGTFASALGAFGRLRQSQSAAAARKRVEPRPEGRKVRALAPKPHREPAIDAWAIPLPTIDPQIVVRSARALERYGPDFSYSHYAWVKRLPVAVGAAGGLAGLLVAAQLPPARTALKKLRAQGSGPSPETIAKGWFTVRFVGEGGGRRVVCEVTGGDPGYGQTSKMLAESALCLAHDTLPETAGQVTTAVAMGDALRTRLERAGMAFRVVERG